MPNIASAKKRMRQNEKRRLHNRALKSEAKTLKKRVAAAVEAKDLARAREEFKRAASKLDKIAKSKVIHRNNASRKKARLARLVGRLERSAD